MWVQEQVSHMCFNESIKPVKSFPSAPPLSHSFLLPSSPSLSPGILSFFAVQAGARKVYAIEASNMAICCLELVKSNRFSEKIVVIPGKVEEVSPPYTHRQTISNIETNNYFFLFHYIRLTFPRELISSFRSRWGTCCSTSVCWRATSMQENG